MAYVVSALYKFVSLPEYKALRTPLLNEMERLDIYGTLLLAKEGINGTVAGSEAAIEKLYQWFAQHPALVAMAHKESFCEKRPFNRTKVKLKKEIVTMGVGDINPLETAGTYVEAKKWNALISSPDVLVVDTRNEYEVKIGTFKGALNPHTETFRELPQFVKNKLDKKKHKKIAMFCTGGIRCEKSTAYLKKQGFDEVYHLKGGILKYLEEVPESDSLWQGECFVFDERVAVTHNLEKGQYDQCHACRYPITEVDKKSVHYEKGVSCPYCFAKTSKAQRERFLEREKQAMLAKKRKEVHIGKQVAKVIAARRQQKKAFKEQQRSVKP